MKLYYDLTKSDMDERWSDNRHFEFEDYIGTTAKTKQPKWFQELYQYVYNNRNKKELIKNNFSFIFDGGPSYKTAKSCPAFINFFKHSLALKTPSDIFIKINKDYDGTYSYAWKTNDPFWKISIHPNIQIGSLKDRCMVLKFSNAFYWTCSEHTQFQYLDPYMHNEIPYRVFPGNVVQGKGTVGSVNMPVMFPTREAEYVIESGTVLGYLYFDKPIKSITRKNLEKEWRIKEHKVHVKQDLKELLSRK